MINDIENVNKRFDALWLRPRQLLVWAVADRCAAIIRCYNIVARGGKRRRRPTVVDVVMVVERGGGGSLSIINWSASAHSQSNV